MEVEQLLCMAEQLICTMVWGKENYMSLYGVCIQLSYALSFLFNTDTPLHTIFSQSNIPTAVVLFHLTIQVAMMYGIQAATSINNPRTTTPTVILRPQLVGDQPPNPHHNRMTRSDPPQPTPEVDGDHRTTRVVEELGILPLPSLTTVVSAVDRLRSLLPHLQL